MKKNIHPYDHTITTFATVHASGLRFEAHDTEEAAWSLALAQCSTGDCIWAVYGPGLRNRLGAVMNGQRLTEAEFVRARGLDRGGNDASMSAPVGW